MTELTSIVCLLQLTHYTLGHPDSALRLLDPVSTFWVVGSFILWEWSGGSGELEKFPGPTEGKPRSWGVILAVSGSCCVDGGSHSPSVP